MTRLPKPGSDDGTWGDILNQFLEVELNPDGSLKRGGDIDAAQSSANSKYTKPGSGIPESDLASAAQTKLDAGATAVQNVNGKTGTSVSLKLDDLSNVTVTGITDGQALVRAGSNWTPGSVGSGYRGAWAPLTAYKANETVKAADGTLQAAKVDFTSGATFSQANWNPVTRGRGVVAGSKWDAASLGPMPAGTYHAVNVPSATRVPGFNHLLIEAANRMQFVNAPRRGPGKTLRMECRQNDYETGGTTDRCEVTQTGNTNADLWADGDEIWLSLSFMIDPNFPTVGGTFANFFQLFAQDIHGEIWPAGSTTPDGDTLGQQSGGSPPFSIAQTVAGTYFSINVRGGPKATSAGQPATSQDANGAYISGARSYNLNTSGDGLVPTAAGVWHDWLVHIKFSTGVDGVTQVWHRLAGEQFPDTPQVDDRGVNVHTIGPGASSPVVTSPLACYLEMGIYRSTDASTTVRYYGGIIARPTRAEAEGLWSARGYAADEIGSAPAVMSGAGPLALGGNVLGGTGSVVVAANRTRLVRWRAPKTGTVSSIDLFVQATSGNVIAGIYDTGDADVTNYTKLGASASTAAGTANTWQRIALVAPVTVTKGRDYMLSVIADNATITFVRGIVLAQAGLLTTLPSGYYDTPGGAGAKLSVDSNTGSFTAPSTVPLTAAADSLVPLIAAAVS